MTKYGPQTSTDPWLTNAGNGISSTNGNACITWNDPNDANFPTNTAFQQAYVQHLIQQWGTSTNGGVRLLHHGQRAQHLVFNASGRPSGWPDHAGNLDQDACDRQHGQIQRPQRPGAGPEEWGWNGYFYSGYDQQWSGQHGNYNPADYPDRGTNGGWDYMPWLLNQFHQHDTNTGQRLLDCFTLHCYPQENVVGGSDVSSATVLLRNQSTRVVLGQQLRGPHLDQQASSC